MKTTGPLHFTFLGTPVARLDGQPIAFATRKAFGLIAYLAIEPGAHTREKLAALLWPESEPAASRASLRNSLASARDSLGAAAACLVVTRNTLQFERTPEVYVDVDSLQAAAQLARRTLGGGLRPLRNELALAAGLAQGEFLEGFSLPGAPEFDYWASLQREHWHRQISLVLDSLSQLHADAGNLTEALDTARRWVELDPLNETAHRRLMQLNWLAGDRSAALQAYAACRLILQRELNAEPGPETDALAGRLRVHSAAALAADRARESSAVLIGREYEHTELADIYRRAHRGRTTAVLLEGEPGIGKTRLAAEFLAWAAAHGATVFSGCAFETDRLLAYHPIVAALRSDMEAWRKMGAATRTPAQSDRLPLLSPAWLPGLCRLLPELNDIVPDLPAAPHLTEAEARTQLFESFVRLGQALAPQVLFVDDAQWADGASLDLLRYAAKRWAMDNTPVLLLLAARTEDLPLLDEWLLRLDHDVRLHRLSLGPLRSDDALALAARLHNGRRPAVDVPALIAKTGGNPYFILQTLQNPAEPLPAGIRNLVRSRLQRLSPRARALCRAAAALGDGFSLEALCRAAGKSEAGSVAAVEELLRRGLLRQAGRHYQFTHDHIRAVAYAELSEARRRLVHRRSADLAPRAPLD